MKNLVSQKIQNELPSNEIAISIENKSAANAPSNERLPKKRLEMMTISIPGYEALQLLQESDRSTIYRAQRLQDNIPVILKVLKPENVSIELKDAFIRECELTQRLQLSGLIAVRLLETHHSALVMECEDFGGTSLNHLDETPSLHECLHVATEVAICLEQLHERDVAHMNIAPSSIIWNRLTGQVKLIDLGCAIELARSLHESTTSERFRQNLAYMAPEQTGRMNRAVDYRSDFYSLGATFYELMTGRSAFAGDDMLEVIHAHIAKEATPACHINPAIPTVVSDILAKLMEKMAEDRYQSASGLVDDLQRCVRKYERSGLISPFVLGESDFSSRLHLPQKFYGRESQLDALLNSFERSRSGQAELLLIGGYSGVGKSALVHELQKPITERCGYFVEGKFDQYNRDIPYSAFVRALTELIHQLLTEGEERLTYWKHQIETVLGRNAKVIADVVPDLALLIGEQPDVPVLPLEQEQNRFNYEFRKFIKIFASSKHPLVIFLDDLQWSDLPSFRLIALLLQEPQGLHLLLIGAYRDNEITHAHPLSLMLADIKRDMEQYGTTPQTISLPPLNADEIAEFLSNALHAKVECLGELVDICLTKTRGNPFFLNQFLVTLCSHGMLWPEIDKQTWQWDVEKIKKADITDNIVDLIAGNLQQLSAATQRVLHGAACLGNVFDLKSLIIVCKHLDDNVANALWPALLGEIIVPLDDQYKYAGRSSSVNPSYRFLHDRIHQAAYQLSGEPEKAATHLSIGRLWCEYLSGEDQQAKLFELVKHFKLGRALIVDPIERRQVAQLNLSAARKAKASAAYKSALNYALTALEMATTDGWQHDYDLTLELHLEAAEAAYMCGEKELMQHHLDIVLKQAKNVLDKTKGYEIQFKAFIAEDQFAEALETGLRALSLLGITYPANPGKFDIALSLLQTKWALAGKSVDSILALPKMNDQTQLAVARISYRIAACAFYVTKEYMPLIMLSQLRRILRHGYCPETAIVLSSYAAVLINGLNAFKQGAIYGNLALAFFERDIDIPDQWHAMMAVQSLVRHWQYPLSSTLPPLRESCVRLMEAGDTEIASNTMYSLCFHAFVCGKSLPDLAQETGEYCVALAHMKRPSLHNSMKLLWQAQKNLMSSEEPCSLVGDACDRQNLQFIEASTNDLVLMMNLMSLKLIMFYFFRDYRNALICANQAKQYERSLLGFIHHAIICFYHSLTCLAMWGDASSKQRAELHRAVIVNQKKMRVWAKHAPTNFLHKWHLVEAESMRRRGKREKAISHYHAAIRLAEENGYQQEQALANELMGDFYASQHQYQMARLHIVEAAQGYRCWGAEAKAKELANRYPQWLSENDGKNNAIIPIGKLSVAQTKRQHDADSLDFTSVMKASQALTKEIVLENLLTRLMVVVIENAGAQCAKLLLKKDDRWFVEAETAHDGVIVMQSTRIDESDDVAPGLPLSLIRYVSRTKESVVLNDARQDKRFGGDRYVQKTQARSLLVMPIINQGAMTGMLCLENSAVSGAFTSDRVEVLHLLASQAAISIENARLYTEMEQRVASRTSEIVRQKEAVEEQKFKVELAHRNISRLSEIGRKITAKLDVDGIVATLYDHLKESMDTMVFGLALYQTEQNEIEFPYTIVNGKRCDTYKRSMLDSNQFSVWCITNRADVLICDMQKEVEQYLPNIDVAMEGKLVGLEYASRKDLPQSAIYVPMILKDSVRGVIAVQSFDKHAYQVVHVDILKTLASYVAVALDNADAYTQLARTMGELQSAQRRLIFQEKMAAIGTLTAGVAHEINNPANFSHVGAQALEMDLERFRAFILKLAGDDPDQDLIDSLNKRIDGLMAQVGTIVEGTTRIREIVKDLQVFSRMDDSNRQMASLSENILSTAQLVRTQFASVAEIRCELSDNPKLECWPGLLSQVFMNLIVNACQAIQSKQLEIGDNSLGLVQIRSKVDGVSLRLEFEDNGNGIPQSELARIFDPFFTTKEVGQGMGLGLSISFGIVEKHGGTIEVRSSEQSGTCFTVKLPLKFNHLAHA